MLGVLRKVSQSWLLLALLAPLAVALVFFGNGQTLPFLGGGDRVASAKGFSIGANQLVSAFDRQLEEVRERNPGQEISREQAISAGFPTTVLRSLISEEAFNALVQRAGLTASDKAVAKQIREIPELRSQITGQFDKTRYQRLLQQNGFSSAKEFETQIRNDLQRAQMSQLAQHGLRPPSELARVLFDLQTEQRLISVVQVSERSITLPPPPTDAQVEAYYRERAASQFTAPERRSLTIFSARAEDFAARVQVSEADVRKSYEFRKAAKSTPELRTFVQVTAPSEAKAQEAARRLAAGENPQRVADAVDGQVVEFTDAKRGDVSDKAVAEAVFKTLPSDATPAIKGDLAWSAAVVTAVTPAFTPKFEDMQAELRKDLAIDAAARMAADAADQFEALLEQGQPAEAAATAAGLVVTKVQDITRQGVELEQGKTLWPGGPLLDVAFETPEAALTPFEDVEGGSAMARVDSIIPAGPLPLARVRPVVEQQWIAQEITNRAKAVAQKIRDEAVASGNLLATAQKYKADVRFTDQVVSRDFFRQAPDPQLGPAIFAAKAGDTIVAFGGAWIVHVKEVRKQSPAQNPLAQQAVEQDLARQYTEDIAFALRSEALAAAKVAINEKRVEQLFKPQLGALAP